MAAGLFGMLAGALLLTLGGIIHTLPPKDVVHKPYFQQKETKRLRLAREAWEAKVVEYEAKADAEQMTGNARQLFIQSVTNNDPVLGAYQSLLEDQGNWQTDNSKLDPEYVKELWAWQQSELQGGRPPKVYGTQALGLGAAGLLATLALPFLRGPVCVAEGAFGIYLLYKLNLDKEAYGLFGFDDQSFVVTVITLLLSVAAVCVGASSTLSRSKKTKTT